MKQLTIKQAKHICAVPGCRSTDTVCVRGSANLLGGIHLCRDCIATLARLIKPKKGERA